MKNRVEYFDTIRFLAALWVFTTHFIAYVDPGLFAYLHKAPLGIFFYGISGKSGVAAFCVILGYFSCVKGGKNGSTLLYIIKRYLYFVCAGLVINLIYLAAARADLIDRTISIFQAIRAGFLISDDILVRFWCMRPFLIGSVFCFINGKCRLGPTEIAAEAAVFILIGQTWAAICLFGSLMAWILQNEKMKGLLEKKRVQAILLAAVFILVKRPESRLTYLIDGACTVAFILVTAHNRLLEKALGNRFFARINKNYMGIYLVNELVYLTAGGYIIHNMQAVPFGPRFLLAYVLSLALTILLAYPLDAVVNCCSNLAARPVDAAWEKVERTVQEKTGVCL